MAGDAVTSMFACSVVIPAFNAAKYIEQTLCSIPSASRSAVQVVVVDDGSTDATLAIVAAMAAQNPDLLVISQKNAGVSAARNAGLAEVRSSYVCFLDADDLLLPGSLSHLQETLEHDPTAIASFGAVTYIDSDGQIDPRSRRAKLTHPRKVRIDDVLQANFIDTPGAILFRTTAVRQLGGFDGSLRIGEDWELYARLASLGDFLFCDQPVIRYRLHHNSAMRHKTLVVSDFEPVLTRLAIVSSQQADLSPRTLQTYEFRRRALHLRQMMQLSEDLSVAFRLLPVLCRLVVRSHADWRVTLLTLRSLRSSVRLIAARMLTRRKRRVGYRNPAAAA